MKVHSIGDNDFSPHCDLEMQLAGRTPGAGKPVQSEPFAGELKREFSQKKGCYVVIRIGYDPTPLLPFSSGVVV